MVEITVWLCGAETDSAEAHPASAATAKKETIRKRLVRVNMMLDLRLGMVVKRKIEFEQVPPHRVFMRSVRRFPPGIRLRGS